MRVHARTLCNRQGEPHEDDSGPVLHNAPLSEEFGGGVRRQKTLDRFHTTYKACATTVGLRAKGEKTFQNIAVSLLSPIAVIPIEYTLLMGRFRRETLKPILTPSSYTYI